MAPQVDVIADTSERTRTYSVDNHDLDLLEFLDRARKRDPLALPVLADWLDERDDPRAGGLRDLLVGVITIPKGFAPRQYVTVAEGPGWVIARSQVMVRLSLVVGSRLWRLLGKEVLYAQQLSWVDRRLLNLHRVVERHRRRAAFALFGSNAYDIEMRSVIAHSLLDREDKDVLFRKYREAASPTIAGVSLAVRHLEVKTFGEDVMRADGEHMLDRFTLEREVYDDIE